MLAASGRRPGCPAGCAECCKHWLLSAQAATDAAAADPERAAQLLLDGQTLLGAPPIDLSRWVPWLMLCLLSCCVRCWLLGRAGPQLVSPLSLAAALPSLAHGHQQPPLPTAPLSPACREVQALAGVAAALGVDAAAVEAQLLVGGGNVDAALEALQSGGGAAPPSASASTVGDPSTAGPDTPSARLPPWAADAASSAFSAPSPAAQSPRAAATPAPGAAPFGATAATEPGVLSLADFSSSPGPDATLAALAANSGGWVAAAEAEAGYAAPAPFGTPLPTPLPLAAQPGPAGFDAGYAAGMAAAAAMLQPQPAAQAYVPPPEVRPEGDDEEVDALLSLLGIG